MVVELEGREHGVAERGGLGHLGHADGRAEVGGLDEEGQAEGVDRLLHRRRGPTRPGTRGATRRRGGRGRAGPTWRCPCPCRSRTTGRRHRRRERRSPRGDPGSRRPRRRARAGRGRRPSPTGCRRRGGRARRAGTARAVRPGDVRASPAATSTSAARASTHCLSCVSPTAVTVQPLSSAVCTIRRAEMHEISCSADGPP